MKKIASDSLRIRKFWPNDRDSPLFEVMSDGEILFDVGRDGGAFSIVFHHAISGVMLDANAFEEALVSCRRKIEEEEAING